MSEFNDKAIKDMLGKRIEKTLVKVGLVVQSEARVLCPVDTGNLRNSINYQTDKENKIVIIGTNVEYALSVEKGINQRPQPYLTPAFEENVNKIQKIINDEFKGG